MRVRPDKNARRPNRPPAPVWLVLAWGALVSPGCATAPPPPPAIPDGSALVASLDPGQSRLALYGCLAEGKRSESKARAADISQPDDLSVRVVAGGVVVTHSLAHPCCLEASTRLTLRGTVATLHERLGGEPCRCECHSTMLTGLGLAVGHWTVRVELEQPDQSVQVVAERRVKVLEPRPELPH